MKKYLKSLAIVTCSLFFFACGQESKSPIPEVESTVLPEFDQVTSANQSYVKQILESSGSGTGKSAQVVSVLTGKGGVCADQHGHVWSSAQVTPTLQSQEGRSQNGKYCGDTLLAFESRLTGLTPGKIYYVRPYATYGEKSVYGKVLKVQIDAAPPVFPEKIMMPEIPVITANSLTIKVYLGGAGDGDVLQHGFVYLEGSSNDIWAGPAVSEEDSKFLYAGPSMEYKLLKLGPLPAAAPGSVIGATILGLKSRHNYKVWAFASNSGGTTFSGTPFIFRAL